MPGSDLYGIFGFPIGRIYTNVSAFRSYLTLADDE